MNLHFRSRRSLAINSAVDLVRASWLFVMVVLLLALTARPSAAINFPCNITLNPPTATLGVAGSSQGATSQGVTATVTKQSDGSVVQGAKVSFSAPSGSLSPTLQNTDANGHATSTFTCGATVGTVTLTATVSWAADPAHNVSASSASANATFTIIGGDPVPQGSNTAVQYYNGLADASSTDPTVTAPGQPTGTTWTWATSSSMSANPQNSSSTPTATLHGVAATPVAQGAGTEWVQITYTLSGVSVSSNKVKRWTVVQPSSLQQLSLTDGVFIDSNYQIHPNGFDSEYEYQVKDQFGSNMTNINVNEDFGTFFSDYPGQNWPMPGPNGRYYPDGKFTDALGADVPAPYTPVSSAPQSPFLGNTKVFHFAHVYRGGSPTPGQGTTIALFTTQFYTDHARNQ